MKVKPGYATTEFWLSVVTAVIGFLVLSGAIPGLDQSAGDAASSAIAQIVEGVVALVSIVTAVISYNQGRAKVKAEASKNGVANVELIEYEELEGVG